MNGRIARALSIVLFSILIASPACRAGDSALSPNAAAVADVSSATPGIEPLEARYFIITTDTARDEAGRLRRKEFVENTKDLLEHMLYSKDGREAAILAGRRIFAGRIPDLYSPPADWDYDGALSVVDTRANLERVTDFLAVQAGSIATATRLSDATELSLLKGKLHARRFRVTAADSADEARRFAIIETVDRARNVLEHMLYTQHGREEAIARGRRIFVGRIPEMNSESEAWDYDGTLTVVDSQDNLDRVAAYFESIAAERESAKIAHPDSFTVPPSALPFVSRKFEVSTPGDGSPEALFRCEQLVINTIQILEHLLHAGSSRELALFNGRRITAGRTPEAHVDEKDWRFDGTVTVTDTRENLWRVEEYFASIDETR